MVEIVGIIASTSIIIVILTYIDVLPKLKHWDSYPLC